MDAVEVKNLSFTYPGCTAPTLCDLSFNIAEGEFVALCGATGSGKSTLLRLLKKEIAPLGEKRGTVRLFGIDADKLSDKESACEIGFVAQRTEQQIVTDKVWHELAFGLESIGAKQDVIRRRVCEMATYFGIDGWFERNVTELSGGQKQLLNLAAVMVMDPKVLILDEPTAQLDPIAASDFIATVSKLNRDMSLTVILAEHRLEEIIPRCDKLMALENGQMLTFERPEKALSKIKDHPSLLQAMPAAARVFGELEKENITAPICINDGRKYITETYKNDIKTIEKQNNETNNETALIFSDVFFRYERKSDDILRGLDFSVQAGEIFCLLGANASGKSTAMKAAAGLLQPYSGKITVFGKKIKDYKGNELYTGCLSMLPQDVQTLFLHDSVERELKGADLDMLDFDFAPLMKKHPYDLSGGEQQMLGLALALRSKPKLLLLDEPTKGLDAAAKNMVARAVRKLKNNGVTILMVTHDVEFAAECADRCALFFRGEVVCTGSPNEFFSGNNFYTTAVSRMTRGIFENAVTVADAVELCRMNGRRK